MHRILAFALFVLGVSALAGPATVTYTSYLTDRNGKPRPLNGQLVYFRLYADSASTTPLWEEYHGIIAPKAFISVTLGSKTPLPMRQIGSATNLWLEMQIITDPAFPRQKIATSFFSIAANFADSSRHAAIADSSKKAGLSANSSKLGGVDANRFLSWNDTGRVDIAPSNGRATVSIPQGKFEINGYSDSYFGIKNPGGSYARLVALDSANQKHFAGLSANGFVRPDGSLKQDSAGRPTWLLGLDGSRDKFSVMRAASGSKDASKLNSLFTLDSNGNATFEGSLNGIERLRASDLTASKLYLEGRTSYGGFMEAVVRSTGRLFFWMGEHAITFSDQDGKIRAAGFVVDSIQMELPDYVFEKDYDLMSLNDVAEFVSVNKHLPGVLSAAEMEKNGVDLLKMNMDLLKKVEELTLYVIQQQREIEELRTSRE